MFHGFHTRCLLGVASCTVALVVFGADEPHIQLNWNVTGQLQLEFVGTLESSTNLESGLWAEISPQPANPWIINPTGSCEFFRACEMSISCAIPKTGQTISYRDDDDGDLQPGTAWPEPRFTTLTNGADITVLDNLTGLEWVQAPHSLSGNSERMVWTNALDFCNALSFAGYDDWRLPSCKELLSLVDYGRYNPPLPSGHPFSGVKTYNGLASSHYWSSTSYAWYGRTHLAWDVQMSDGYMILSAKTEINYVWSVRSRQEGNYSCPVPKTGQTTSYHTGDDGDLQSGTAWPEPRFTTLTNGADIIVLDSLTGLEWVQAPHSLSGNSEKMVWNSAVDFCRTLSFAEHDDWRLPSVKELESLVNFGNGSWGDEPNEWLNSDEAPFSGVHGKYDEYWSGTSLARFTSNAWPVSLGGGHINRQSKIFVKYAWPVRSR